MRKIKTGLIGCGKVGHIHARALSRLPQSEFVAACGRDSARTRTFAEQYGVQPYTDVKQMISETGVRAVTLGTPHPAHAGPAIAAVEAGAHVLVEKPLASSLADCDAMISAASAAGVKLGMISQRRLYAPVQRIKRAIDGGKIGEPILGVVTMYGWRDKAYYDSDGWRGTWEKEGGGVLVNQAPHQLDILQWFMGSVDELFGYWGNLNHPYIEVEDTAVAVIRFKNGALGNVLVSNSQNPALYGRVAVFGSNGAGVGVKTDGGAMFVAGMSSIAEPPVNDLWTIPGERDKLEQWVREDGEFFNKIEATEYYHELQIRDFLEAIVQDRPLQIPAEEGRKTVELFTAIYRSQRDRRPVKFPLEAENEAGDYDGRISKKERGEI